MNISSLLISNSLTINFERRPDVRSCLGKIENILLHDKSNFLAGSPINVPEGIEPSIPRIIFDTKHRHAQLTVSQNAIAINTQYSEDYQKEPSLGEAYLTKHADILFKLLDTKIIDRKALFCGVASIVHIPMAISDQEIIKFMCNAYKIGNDTKSLFDLEIKFTHVVQNKYFNNCRIQNYRTAEQMLFNPFDITPVPEKAASSRGLQLVMDFNDRYAFNETSKYTSSAPKCRSLIKYSFDNLRNELKKLEK